MRGAVAERLGSERAAFERILNRGDLLADHSDEISERAARTVGALKVLDERVTALAVLPGDCETAVIKALGEFQGSVASFVQVQIDYAHLAGLVVETVAPNVEQESNTAGWGAVLMLCDDLTGVVAALSDHSARVKATQRLKTASTKIDNAVRAVTDGKLLTMSDGIRKWWNLMRPGELTRFDDVVRRGAGRRYVDVTASLDPTGASPGIVRNALAVFSNSQLNALGLSAFLARTHLLDVPMVLLDDPVPGSDREHRSNFASDVVGQLLADGRQVVITTHDSELARHLHTYHQHLGVDEFEVTLAEPDAGTRIVPSGDEFERRMLNAKGQLNSPLKQNRCAAGNELRIATERLAKHVVVAGRRRAGQQGATLADLDNKNLKDLRPLCAQYALKPNEPGMWEMLARLLNDADHDTLDPPSSSELHQCHSHLRQLKRTHSDNDPKLSLR